VIEDRSVAIPASIDIDESVAQLLDELLDDYGMDAGTFLGHYDWLWRMEGNVPWALVVFQNDYLLAGHMRQVSRLCPGVRGESFSGLFFNELLGQLAPEVSFVVIETKSALCEAAKISPLLKGAWEHLAERPTNRHWLCISDPPPEQWLMHTISSDSELLLSECENFPVEEFFINGRWLNLAHLAQLLFGSAGIQKATDYLHKAEAESSTSIEMVQVIRQWMKLGSPGLKHAMRCARKAEKDADDFEAWSALAGVCIEHEDAFMRASSCLEEAEKLAKTSLDYRKCAFLWSEVDSDSSLARSYRNLLLAEEHAQNTNDWSECALGWHLVFGEKSVDKAVKCAERAELLAVSCEDKINAAETWSNFLDESGQKHYRRCFNTAQSLALTSEDWANCAASIYQQPEGFSRQDVRRFVLLAEQSARSSVDLCICASAWSEVFDYEFNVDEERCLIRAEKQIADVKEAIECATTCWTHSVHVEKNVPRFLTLAENISVTPEEWRLCATAWEELWADKHGTEAAKNARRCDSRAQQVTRS
ncbi:MAG: hypothetical protein GX811_00080, partial [Lentisphaerae bacterium]|nr:hypothetical protein [Lentisphaerota bacterium]